MPAWNSGKKFTRKTAARAVGGMDGVRRTTTLALDPAEFEALAVEAFEAGISLREHIRVLIGEAQAARSARMIVEFVEKGLENA